LTWYQDKTPEDVRASALEMAAKKAREDCAPCADAYLDLARRHGATDEEIEAIMAEARCQHDQMTKSRNRRP
jgi:hypothetical protein